MRDNNSRTEPCSHPGCDGEVSFRMWSTDCNGNRIYPRKGRVLAICSNPECPYRAERGGEGGALKAA